MKLVAEVEVGRIRERQAGRAESAA